MNQFRKIEAFEEMQEFRNKKALELFGKLENELSINECTLFNGYIHELTKPKYKSIKNAELILTPVKLRR